jgi:hypothetical protein
MEIETPRILDGPSGFQIFAGSPVGLEPLEPVEAQETTESTPGVARRRRT